MDLRALEAIVAIHEHGSFSAAAERLFLSQPALTRRVAMLERELGVKVFVRTSRGVHLTEAGEALIEPTRRALRETGAIRDAVQLVRRGTRGTLTVIGTTDLSRALLGELVGRFHEAFPSVAIRAGSASSDAEALAAVASSAFDLAIVELPADADGLEVTYVGAEELVVVLGPGGHNSATTEAELPVVTPEQLRGRTLIHLPMTRTRNRAGSLFASLGEAPASRLEVSSCELISPIMRWTHSVAILPRPDAIEARAEGLTLAALPKPARRHIGLVRRAGTAGPTTRRFLELAAVPEVPSSLSSGGTPAVPR
ncbi:LysR family transcriptional regulator [Gryllotalpicola protaetiae]|uniref:LysR family transcriptional regulator n=1 Tax=Gryllotalpicola protaetiae TaxID=2419771 RepID=A0A387BSW9_9MICO|nr:LysR family transcriptional regulator [Gryllotalpicola protaetiae]AYG04047.1 LysR family transcriptional regulator [Gryllotalpicola protaetiae]